MPTTDPISDLLTRIRNGQMASLKQVRAPYSNIKFAIAKIMEKEGYLSSVKIVEAANSKFKDIEVSLKYEGKRPVIRKLKRISTPGRRMYAKVTELPRVYSDIGIAIISTPNGLMTNKDARKRRLGGEVLCEIF
ncbi:30S ribosomal protein S8 [Candidatus Uhrbacteria bacterium]|nr:30S ribosomal protein S8 [Candidatus Uhrbacteria bacterium]